MSARRRFTQDLAAADPPTFSKHSMLSAEQIGPKRHLTPEGFLLCEDVPLARVGWMVYGPGETPVKTGDNGVSLIHRTAEDLFNPQTIASFAGKSITNDHPPMGVTPENWSKVTVGTVHNLRRGAGEDHDVLLGDLLVTDAAAIRAVQQGKREVSAGYDAEYETTGPGEGRQKDIIGNHIALVERGRCGPRCAIGDRSHQPTERKASMPQAATSGTPRRRLSDAARQIVLDKGAAAMSEALDELDVEGEDDGATHVHVHLGEPAKPAKTADAPAEGDEDPLDARFKKMETTIDTLVETVGTMAKTMDAMAKGKPADVDPGPGDEDDDDGDGSDADASKGKTNDSTALETSFKELLADAEILVPGFSAPTFDAKAKRKVTVDSMCALRRRALDAVAMTTEGVALISAMNGGKTNDMATLDCAAIATVFKSAAAAKRLVNNRASTGDSRKVPDAPPAYAAPSISSIQAQNAKTYPRPA